MAAHFISGNYGEEGNPSQTYDYYPGTTPTSPLLIYVHGGAWRFGDKSSFHRSDNDVHKIREYFQAAGFATATINYRLSHEALFPAQIHDVKAAIRYLKQHAKILGFDPAKIALAGGSAGGHLVQLAAASTALKDPYFEGLPAADIPAHASSSVSCAVSIYGVSDLRTIFDDRVACGFDRNHPEDDGAEWRLLGSPYPAPVGSTAETNWSKAHPIDLAQQAERTGNRRHASVFYVHGTGDTCVPPNQSEKAHRALGCRGVPTELLLVPGAEHADPAIYADRKAWERIIGWVQAQLTLRN
ncbi:esterase/lipase [Mycobacteroides abscessus subsp. bolletii]|nr:esterase/lipase [Mycobacteroides abscessus subsp. bolletii]